MASISRVVLACFVLAPSQAVKRAQADHKAAKEAVKQCGLAVNSAKREIDHVTSALGAKRVEGTAGEADMLDSEEHQLVQTLKSAKMKFKKCVAGSGPCFCRALSNSRVVAVEESSGRSSMRHVVHE